MPITMTVVEVVAELQKVGMKTSSKHVADSIESGAYPFGRMVKKSGSGYRSFEIFRADFFAWLDSKMLKEDKR